MLGNNMQTAHHIQAQNKHGKESNFVVNSRIYIFLKATAIRTACSYLRSSPIYFYPY